VKKAADVVRKAAAKENNTWRACAKATRRTGTGWAGCPCGAYRVCPACRKADVARANLREHLVLCTTKRTGAQPKLIGASSPPSPFTAGFVFSGPGLCLPRFGPCSPKSKPSGANFSTKPIANAIIKENTRPSGGSLTVGTAPNSWYASYPSLEQAQLCAANASYTIFEQKRGRL